MPSRRLLLAALVAVLVAGPVFATGAARAGDGRAPVERVLLLSLPHLAWSDLGTGAAPRLDDLLDGSAVGNLSVRAARRRTTPGEGYATIGAGTRAGAPEEIDGVALGPDEPFEGGTAAEAYQRRFGLPVGAAAAANLSAAAYHEVNDRLLFGGEVGTLGDALAGGGAEAAVVGNADLARHGEDPAGYGRQAVAALMGPDGRLAGGRVDRGLLRPDSAAPFGHRLDREAVVAAFEAAWRGRSVVLVEASDLTRADAYGEFTPPGRREAMLRLALGWTDELVADLLARVDPARHAVLVVAPASPRAQARLTVAALRAPGQREALLRSASTRRSGFVTMADVGPTVLSLLGVPRPASMEGRPMEAGRAGGTTADRRRFLVDTERDARFRDSLVTPVALGFVVAQVALSAVAVLVLRRERGRGRGAVEVAALALLGALPFTYLAGLIPFSRLGTGAYVGFVVAGAVGVALAARALDRGRRDLLPVQIALGVVVTVIAGSALFGSRLQLNTVFGDSPIVAGRFTGINNLTFAQLVTAAVLLAAFAAHRLGGRRGALVGLALLAAVVVVDGLPAWGADVGGVLSAVPAFALVASLLLGWRVGPRTAVFGAAGTVAAIAVFTLVDLSRPSSSRTHLGRLFEQMDTGGWDALAQVLERKLNANLDAIIGSPWTLMVPPALAFVAYLMYRSPSALGAIQCRLPELRFALAGVLVAGVLGFALNDSGIAVPGMMLGVLNPVLVYLAARWT